jgi:hypothetical protein
LKDLEALLLSDDVLLPERASQSLQVNYSEKVVYGNSDSDEDFDGSEEPRAAKKSAPKETAWSDVELKRLEDKLVSLGEGRWGKATQGA